MADTITTDICCLIDSMVTSFKDYIEQGTEQADVTEMGEVADIIKDLSEAYCHILKGEYHKEVTESMQNGTDKSHYDEMDKADAFSNMIDDIESMLDGESADFKLMVRQRLSQTINKI